jgi:multidrug efflux pump subunit AcrB
MYALLVLQFNSYTYPLLIFLGVPFSFPLLFPGLALTDNKFSFFTVLGLMGLMGIVVNNTIMLLDFAKIRMDEENKTPREAIVGALKRRFRPLVATTATTVAGLLPMALTDPFWESMALTMIFGLISSTTMVIIVFPVYYFMLEHTTRFFSSLPKRLSKRLKY